MVFHDWCYVDNCCAVNSDSRIEILTNDATLYNINNNNSMSLAEIPIYN